MTLVWKGFVIRTVANQILLHLPFFLISLIGLLLCYYETNIYIKIVEFISVTMLFSITVLSLLEGIDSNA